MDWIQLLLGLATAAATSITAYVVYQQWHGGIEVECDPVWHDRYNKGAPPLLEIKLTVRNYHRFAIQAWRAEVRDCPVQSVTTRGREKHESWAENQTPLYLDIDPGASGSCTILVLPDWKSLAARHSDIDSPSADIPLRVYISSASKTHKPRKIERHTTINISRTMISKAAKAPKA